MWTVGNRIFDQWEFPILEHKLLLEGSPADLTPQSRSRQKLEVLPRLSDYFCVVPVPKALEMDELLGACTLARRNQLHPLAGPHETEAALGYFRVLDQEVALHKRRSQYSTLLQLVAFRLDCCYSELELPYLNLVSLANQVGELHGANPYLVTV